MLKANQFATCDCEISWLFSLAFTCQSLLIFESCIIIQNLLNQHLMMLFLHVVHTQWLWVVGFPLVLQNKANLYLIRLVSIQSIHYKHLMLLLLMRTLVYNLWMWIFWSYSLGLTLKHNFNIIMWPNAKHLHTHVKYFADFCHLLITFANCLGPDQTEQFFFNLI